MNDVSRQEMGVTANARQAVQFVITQPGIPGHDIICISG